MKKILTLILALLMVASCIVACNNEETPSSSTSLAPTSSVTPPTSSEGPSSSTPPVDDDNPPTSADGIVKIDYAVDVNQSFNSSLFNDLSSFGNSDVAMDYPDATPADVTGGIKIEVPGIYRIYGSSTVNGIEIDIDRADKEAALQEVVLVLAGARIENSADALVAPIISKGCNVRIILLDGTENVIIDNRPVDGTTSSEKGAIYVKTGNLTIEGSGLLKIDTKYKNAIFCTKSITIEGGVFDLTSNYNGIYASGERLNTDSPDFVGGLTINSGDFTINSKRAGLKAGELDEETATDIKGKLVINGGKFNIKSTRNAIDCYGEIIVNGGGFKIESSADGINATDKVTFAQDTNTVMIINSADSGVKCDNTVLISDLTNLKIVSKKDGIDAKDVEIDIAGGVVYIVTNPSFVEDMETGEYIRDENKEYHKIDPLLYPDEVLYSVAGSAKGIDASNSIIIKNGIIAIDSVEEAIDCCDGDVIDEATVNTITIAGGMLSLDTSENAIKADNSITISGTTTQLSVLRADKALNADNITISEARVALVAISDAIDSDNVVVNSGEVYLFDKVDLPAEGGTFAVNGGTVVCLSTTKNPNLPTSTTYTILSKTIENPVDYVYGNYANIKGGAIDITLLIPKSYAEKLSVVVLSSQVTAGEYTISAGSYTDGKMSMFVCHDGTFVAKTSESVTVQ